MNARAVWKFFRAASVGDSVVLFDGDDARQAAGRLSFFRVRQRGSASASRTTCGRSRRRPADGQRRALRRHGRGGDPRALRALQGRGRVPRQPRDPGARDRNGGGCGRVASPQAARTVGLPPPERRRDDDRFQAHYQGKRYSSGYPACPDLGPPEAASSRSSTPGEIGVTLTEEMMMEREAWFRRSCCITPRRSTSPRARSTSSRLAWPAAPAVAAFFSAPLASSSFLIFCLARASICRARSRETPSWRPSRRGSARSAHRP